MVGCWDNHCSIRFHIWFHPKRSDLTVPTRLLGVLLGSDLLAACVLPILHVRPGSHRCWRGGRPVRELHRPAHSLLGTSGTELLRVLCHWSTNKHTNKTTTKQQWHQPNICCFWNSKNLNYWFKQNSCVLGMGFWKRLVFERASGLRASGWWTTGSDDTQPGINRKSLPLSCVHLFIHSFIQRLLQRGGTSTIVLRRETINWDWET